MSTTGTVNAPQFGRGISVLQEARTRHENTQKEIAEKKNSEEKLRQILVVARRERGDRIKNTEQIIAKLLNKGKYQEAQEKVTDEIHRMLDELKLHADPQDRLWIAKKVLHFTSWRGMKSLNYVEEVLTSAFGENIPDEIAERLAQLIDKQTEFLRKSEAKKGSVMRSGKTARDRQNGALKRHESNVARRASENRERAQGGTSDTKKDARKKK